MGMMDGLCCANVNNVSDSTTDEIGAKKDNLKKFFTAYDLNYLNSTVGESSHQQASTKSNPSAVDEHHQPSSMEFKNTSLHPEVTKEHAAPSSPSDRSAPLLHTILPNSFLPREYGSPSSPSKEEVKVERSYAMTVDHDDDAGNFCHGCPQFSSAAFDDDQQQPHTLTPSDTYTTVSLTQSYMWDEDDDEFDEAEDAYTLSPATSVFRIPGEGSRASTKVASSVATSFSEKTHEAYNFLLRMQSQNYIHGSSSSSDDCESYSNRCGLFLEYTGYDDILEDQQQKQKQGSSLAMPRLEQM